MKPFKRSASGRVLSILLFLVGLIGLPMAKADILRLRDGRMFTGEFLGATKDQIWFQADSPVNMIGPTAYAVVQVESLTFGPAQKQSNTAHAMDPACNATNCRNPFDAILMALARESQKTYRPSDQRFHEQPAAVQPPAGHEGHPGS
jgi:hypothetical protein